MSYWAEFRKSNSSKGPGVHVGQRSHWPKVVKKLGQGAFIRARGQSGQSLKKREFELARGRSSLRLNWPGVDRARGRSGQKDDVKGAVNVAGSCRWAS